VKHPRPSNSSRLALKLTTDSFRRTSIAAAPGTHVLVHGSTFARSDGLHMQSTDGARPHHQTLLLLPRLYLGNLRRTNHRYTRVVLKSSSCAHRFLHRHPPLEISSAFSSIRHPPLRSLQRATANLQHSTSFPASSQPSSSAAAHALKVNEAAEVLLRPSSFDSFTT
jgi:hypothetical protein